MYGLWIGIAVFGIAGAFISALPVIARFRRRRQSAQFPEEFLRDVVAGDKPISLRYRRTKLPFREGFADVYEGIMGRFVFRLDTQVIPFRSTRLFRLRLATTLDQEPISREWSADVETNGYDPLAHIAQALRCVHAKREGYHILEAS